MQLLSSAGPDKKSKRVGFQAALTFLLVWQCAVSGTVPAEDKYVTGLVLIYTNSKFVVRGALPSSPAERSDLQEGDIVLEIDSVPTATMTWEPRT